MFSRMYHKIFHSNDLKGIGHAVLGCFWFAVMALIIRHLSLTVDIYMMVFVRNCCSVLILLPWLPWDEVRKHPFKRQDLLWARAVTGVVGMTLYFVALKGLPVTQVTAVSFTMPLITTLMAAIFLKEKVSWHFILALLWGFLGVLVIVHFGVGRFSMPMLAIIVGTFFWSASNIFVKKLVTVYSPLMSVFTMMACMAVVSFFLVIFHWQALNLVQFLWLIALGAVTVLGQLALTNAYHYTDVKVVMPFDFLRLLFVSALAFIFLQEKLEIHTLIGAVMIMGSSLYTAFRVSKKNQPLVVANEEILR
jgi:drug/metabolite transporter (DMT)-like permease